MLQTQNRAAVGDTGQPGAGHPARLHRGTWDCIRSRWAAQGLPGLYTGAFPQLFNAVLKEVRPVPRASVMQSNAGTKL